MGSASGRTQGGGASGRALSVSKLGFLLRCRNAVETREVHWINFCHSTAEAISFVMWGDTSGAFRELSAPAVSNNEFRPFIKLIISEYVDIPGVTSGSSNVLSLMARSLSVSEN